MAGQNPTGTDTSEAILQGNPVSQIPADRAEGVLSLLKLTPHDQPSSMGDLIASHHQTRLANAQMYSNAAKAALHSQLMIQHGIDPESGQRFDDPAYKGPSAEEQTAKYNANYNEAWTNYKKLAGVDQNTKGALAKAEQILNHILGGGAMQSAPGAPSDQGRPGGMAPPPQAGLTGNAGGPSQVEAATPLPAAGMTPPPKPADVSSNPLAAPMMEAQTQFEQSQQRRTAEDQRAFQVQHAQWKAEADKLFEPGSREYKWYAATGKLPPVAHLQKTIYKDPRTGEVMQGFADPLQGTILDQTGEVVEGAQPATPGMITPKPFKYLSPDGKSELPGFQVGTTYYDQQMQPLPAGTQLYARGLVPTETLHQQITYDAQGNQQINTLKTIRTPLPQAGSTGSVGAAPRAGTGGAASAPTAGGGQAGAASPTKAGRKGGVTAPPTPSAPVASAPPAPRPPVPGASAAAQGAQAVDALGKPLGSSAGMWQNARKAIIPVRGAATQLFGDPTQPELKGFQDYAHLADDTPERKDLANALQLAFNDLEHQEKASGGLRALLGNYAGEPQALIDSQTGVMQDVIGKLSPENQEAFNAAMAVYGTVMGLRSLTGAGAYQFSVKAMEREVPLPGLNTFSRPQFYDKMSRLAEEVYNGSKNLPMPQSERDFYASKVREYRQLATGRKGGATPPPASGAPASSGSSGGFVKF